MSRRSKGPGRSSKKSSSSSSGRPVGRFEQVRIDAKNEKRKSQHEGKPGNRRDDTRGNPNPRKDTLRLPERLPERVRERLPERLSENVPQNILQPGEQRPRRTLRERLLREVQRLDGKPATAAQFTKRLKPAEEAEVAALLETLEREGFVARIRGNQFISPTAADLVTGIFHVNPRGFGHVVPGVPNIPDLYIPAEEAGTAMHGDRVMARIQREGRGEPGRDRGRVIRVLDRANEEIVGTFQQSRGLSFVIPDNPRIIHNIYVPGADLGDRQAQPGDKVVARLLAWESRHQAPEGLLVEIIGAAGQPGVDMEAILRAHHIRGPFPDEVIAEAEAIATTVPPEEALNREDFRSYTIATIDPDDARDFDDAIHVETTANGWRLQVHIADVAHYVRPGMALDREARRRGNSVYFPDRVVPMLPPRLSNGICSLRPNEDRLVYSAVMEFDRAGNRTASRFGRGIICSAARLTYKQAFKILGEPPSQAKNPVEKMLHEAWRLASLLRRNRFAEGSLDLDFPEVKVRVNRETGKTESVEKIENDISHQLIEEFMLAANEAVGAFVKNRSIPSIYRVHEQPDPGKLLEYRETLAGYGYKVGDLTQRSEISKLLAAIRGTPEEYGLKTAFLKSLQRARYDTSPLGHYGLAKADYGHFTSPIRRYADLTLHRSLDVALGKAKNPASAGELAEIAAHISSTEREAQDAEREAVRLKLLEYFIEEAKSQNAAAHDAVVLDVRNFGLLVELPDFLITGIVHVTALDDDFYRFDPSQRRLIGRRNNRSYSAGDRVKVAVAKVDLLKRQVDFRIAPAGRASQRPAPQQQTPRGQEPQQPGRSRNKPGQQRPGAEPQGKRHKGRKGAPADTKSRRKAGKKSRRSQGGR